MVQATPYDKRLFGRGLLFTLVALALLGLLSAATDEGGVALLERIGRVLPLVPVAAAMATGLVVAQQRSRGEERALSAMGARPERTSAPAALGASLVALAAALAIGLGPALPIGGFFPQPPNAPAYRDEGTRFVSTGEGIAVDLEGEIEIIEKRSEVSLPLPRGARGSAAITTALSGLALCLAIARTRRENLGRSIAVISAFAVATLLAFQLAAASRLTPVASTVPAALVLGATLRSYRRPT